MGSGGKTSSSSNQSATIRHSGAAPGYAEWAASRARVGPASGSPFIKAGQGYEGGGAAAQGLGEPNANAGRGAFSMSNQNKAIMDTALEWAGWGSALGPVGAAGGGIAGALYENNKIEGEQTGDPNAPTVHPSNVKKLRSMLVEDDDDDDESDGTTGSAGGPSSDPESTGF